HQGGGDGAFEKTSGVPGLPLERLDQFFEFCRRFRQLAGRWFGHGLGATVMTNRVPSPAWYSGRSVVPTRSRGRPVWPTRSTISRRWAGLCSLKPLAALLLKVSDSPGWNGTGDRPTTPVSVMLAASLCTCASSERRS